MGLLALNTLGWTQTAFLLVMEEEFPLTILVILGIIGLLEKLLDRDYIESLVLT